MTSPSAQHRRALVAVVAQCVALVAVVAQCVALVLAVAGCGGSSHSRAGAQNRPSAQPSPGASSASPEAPAMLALPKVGSLVATATAKRVVVRRTPHGAAGWSLRNPNNLGAPLVFTVIGESPGWWKVELPLRPNGSVGWVSVSDVLIELDPYSVIASLSRHTLTVVRYGRVVRRFPIGVGRPTAPTPTGTFYLTELLEAAHPDGPYGPFAYGTSAFSDVFSEFEGGPGQIGIHGTNDPSSVGRNVSHGCIRLHNSDMAKLATMVPAGTPLTIEA